MKRSKLFCIVIIVIMLFLSACAQKGDTTSTTSGKSNTQAVNKNLPSSLKSADLTILDYGEKEFENLRPAVEEFQKKYGGNIQPILATSGEAEAKIITSYASGDPIDVIRFNHNQILRLIVKGIAQPLDELLDFNDPILEANMLEPFKYNNRIYGVLQNAPGVAFTYYNKTLFENNGAKTPDQYLKEGKWNWSTFRELAETLSIDVDKDGWIDIFGWGAWNPISNFVINNGGSFVELTKDGKGIINIDNPKTIEALQFFQDLTKYEDTKFNANFPIGKVAMVINRGNFAGGLKDMKDEWDILPMPDSPQGKPGVTPATSAFFGISTGSKNAEGAAAFLYLFRKTKYGREDEHSVMEPFSDQQKQKIMQWRKNICVDFAEAFGMQAKQRNDITAELRKGTPVMTVVEKYKPMITGDVEAILNEIK